MAVSTPTNATEENDIPPHVWDILHEFLIGIKNPNLDLREPYLRTSLKNLFPFIIFVYSLLLVFGVTSNLALLVHVLRQKSYHHDPTYSFLLNNAISDITKCILVLPMSLYVLLVQNWTLGELLCSFLPMIQDIPIHTTTLSFLLLAWDRFRFIRDPRKPRLPAFVCNVGSWLTAVCLVLPYPIYIIYVDLGKYSNMSIFNGVGLCIVNLADDMKEYMRGIFLMMYAGPLATISYLFVRTSRELMVQNTPAVILFETRTSREGRSRANSHSTTTDLRSSRGECDASSQYSTYRDYDAGRMRYEVPEPDIDVLRERRTQKYLVAMVTVYAVCMCPLMILRLARLALVETYDNSSKFDITYTVFVWVAFMPTCVTPVLFASWQMSRTSKERLKGYFRFSNRKLRHSCETVMTSGTGTPACDRSKCHKRHQDTVTAEDDDNSLQRAFQVPSS